MKTTMKTTMFVAALAAMILGQAAVSAADSTPAILKSVKAKQTLNKGQMKKVKGEHYANNYNYAYNNNYAYGNYPYGNNYAYGKNYAYGNYPYGNKYASGYNYGYGNRYNNAYLYNGYCK